MSCDFECFDSTNRPERNLTKQQISSDEIFKLNRNENKLLAAWPVRLQSTTVLLPPVEQNMYESRYRHRYRCRVCICIYVRRAPAIPNDVHTLNNIR